MAHPAQLPAEPLAAEDFVSIKFTPMVGGWSCEAKCKHAAVVSPTYTAQGSLNYAAMVENTRRNHTLQVGCKCPNTAPLLNASVTYAPSVGVLPGEQRIVLEQTATIPPPAKNFSFHGRLTCTTAGAYYIDAKLVLAKSVSSGARGFGLVFVSGNPPMLSVPLVDVASKATAVLTGTVNLLPNQPLAFAYLNTGQANQDVQSTTLSISEEWVP